MTGFRVHYTHHAVREMKKAKVTRQQVRLTIQYGRRDPEVYRTSGERGWCSTLRIEQVTVAAVWVKRKARLTVVTVYRVGEYD